MSASSQHSIQGMGRIIREEILGLNIMRTGTSVSDDLPASTHQALDCVERLIEQLEAERERHLHSLRMIVAAAPKEKAHVAREELRKAASSPATSRCEKCRHEPHVPGACGVNVGTGYMGAVLCQCGVPDPASELPCYTQVLAARLRDEQNQDRDPASSPEEDE